MEATVKLNGMDAVRDFLSAAAAVPEDLKIRSGKTEVNAKSVMGLFSLDLSRPLTLCIDADRERCREICAALRPWIIA